MTVAPLQYATPRLHVSGGKYLFLVRLVRFGTFIHVWKNDSWYQHFELVHSVPPPCGRNHDLLDAVISSNESVMDHYSGTEDQDTKLMLESREFTTQELIDKSEIVLPFQAGSGFSAEFNVELFIAGDCLMLLYKGTYLVHDLLCAKYWHQNISCLVLKDHFESFLWGNAKETTVWSSSTRHLQP
jgi:hypothetical protein